MAVYEYQARCLEVIDGRTVKVELDLGFNVRTTVEIRAKGLVRSVGSSVTDRQRAVLDAIREGTCNGVAPTIREIGDLVGISSSNGVLDHLKALRRKGLVAWEENKSRTIRVIKNDEPPGPECADRMREILCDQSPHKYPLLIHTTRVGDGYDADIFVLAIGENNLLHWTRVQAILCEEGLAAYITR